MELITRFLYNVLVLLIISAAFAGISVSGVYGGIVAVVVLALLNIFIKPLLFIVTLPITIVTLGLFTVVLNALLLLFTASILEGLDIDGFWWAIAAAITISAANYAFNKFVD
jgi:putative membrane protein